MKNNDSVVSKTALMSALLSGALYLASGLQLSDSGLRELKRHEGYRETPYYDQAGVLTVCYGSTRSVHPARKYSSQECTERLKEDVDKHTEPVGRLVAVPLTQGQYDALGDFVYQFGETRFKGSTLLKKLNSWDCWGAAEEFRRWVNVGGKPNRGVQKRREDNIKVFHEGCVVWDRYGL